MHPLDAGIPATQKVTSTYWRETGYSPILLFSLRPTERQHPSASVSSHYYSTRKSCCIRAYSPALRQFRWLLAPDQTFPLVSASSPLQPQSSLSSPCKLRQPKLDPLSRGEHLRCHLHLGFGSSGGCRFGNGWSSRRRRSLLLW